MHILLSGELPLCIIHCTLHRDSGKIAVYFMEEVAKVIYFGKTQPRKVPPY